jgi:hypothetical protein
MRRLAVAGLAGLLACMPEREPPLQYRPCEPERVGHVESFGYYASETHLAETASYSNTAWVWPSDVSRAAAEGLRSVVYLHNIFAIWEPTRPSDADVEQAWLGLAEVLRPLRSSIAALYPSDEPYANGALAGVPLEEIARRLEHAARVIRATAGFEDVPIAVIVANPELDWIASGAARNPAGFNWIGFDYYAQSPAELASRTALLLELLRPDQRVIVVPDAMLLAGSSQDMGALEERIAFWLGWVERQPEVVAVAPFIFWTGTDRTASWVGARDLPTVRDRYAQIGACIVQSAAARAAAERSAGATAR